MKSLILLFLCCTLGPQSKAQETPCYLCSDFGATSTPGNWTLKDKAMEGKYSNYSSFIVTRLMECLFLCTRSSCKCMSFNFKTIPEKTGGHLCELNSEAGMYDPTKLVPRIGYSFHDIMEIKREGTCGSETCLNNCCDTSPCYNNGVCQNICNQGIRRVRCVCSKGFSGRFCRTQASPVVVISGIIGTSKILTSSDSSLVEAIGQWLVPALGTTTSWSQCFTTDSNIGSNAFHSVCDQHQKTLVLIKVGTYVYGGFSDVSWKEPSASGGYGTSSNAVIFGLKPDLFVLKIRAGNEAFATYRISGKGPTFGEGPNYDLEIGGFASLNSESNTNPGGTYENPPVGKKLTNASNPFKIDMYEVFFLN